LDKAGISIPTSGKLHSAFNGFRVPIMYRNETFGILDVGNLQHAEYAQLYLDEAAGIAKVAAMAMANARVYGKLQKTVDELSDALANVKVLRGLLPICASCKRIRDDDGYWESLEDYLTRNTDVLLSHGICKDCTKELYPDMFDLLYPDSETESQP